MGDNYYARNKAQILDRNKQYALEHKEQIKAQKAIYQKKWYAENREEKLKSNSEWQRKNPEKMMKYQPDNNTKVKLRYWSKAVRLRDNNICQDCGLDCIECGSEAHHVLSKKYYPEFQFIVSNGITVCKPCHNEYTWGVKLD